MKIEVVEKEFRNIVHKAQFISEHPEMYDGLVNVAIHEWLATGHSIRITADVPDVKILEEVNLNSDDVEKAVFEYVLTHEAEVDKMEKYDPFPVEPIYNGIMFQKGNEVVWEMDVDTNK